MSRSRVVVAVAGIVAVALGVGTAAVPSLSTVVPVPPIPISVVGALSLLVAVLVALRRRDSVIRGAEPDAVEDALEQPHAGIEFDEAVRLAGGVGIEAARQRREGREHLADVAIEVLVAVDGYSPEEADAALARGTWTDDPIAAGCFATEPPSRGLGGIVSQYFDRRPSHERELAHAVEALKAKIDGEAGR